MHLRGIKEAADHFLQYYQAESGTVHNLAFWELAATARPLPDPVAWIPASRRHVQLNRTDCPADTDYVEFVTHAIQSVKYG